MRLVNGVTDREGRVEIFISDEWGMVCDNNWDDVDARVVCRQMGYIDGRAMTGGRFGKSDTSVMWMDEVDCKETSPSLDSCIHGGWTQHNCSSFAAGVECLDELQGKL